MNPKLAMIFARRSVRQFANRDVSDADIRDLLEAAMCAPAAVGKDPWQFIVVRNPGARRRLTEALPNGHMLIQAPVAIVVCGDRNLVHDHQESYLLQDCSAAIENLLIAAPALGLGACWLGVHPRAERVEAVRRQFALPEHVLPVAVVAVGWPAQMPPPRSRWNDAAVHRETW